MKDIRGSLWRKWDLHFHTMSSYDYENKSVTNQEIVDELIRNEIEVVAVTDHHTIDVIRIKALQKLGEGKITFLPGIEFLGEVRGREPLHYIAIFAEDCDLDYVWGQIENGTEIKHIKGRKKEPNQVYCDLLDTTKLIKELGGLITIHAGSKTNGIENITHSLAHNLAQKEDIARAVDIFELGDEKDIQAYNTHVIPFLQREIEKTLPLIICSDNHNVKKYSIKQNLWIKGDKSFSTLRQLINHPDRAYIGSKPPGLQIVESNPTKYIEKIIINKKVSSVFEETWFNNVEIAINPGLVAIIGNKGNGKSALTDILGLCGNTHNHSGFSFLHPKKFWESKRKKAENFEATLTWKNGKTITCCLSHEIDVNQEERIKYIPQSYLERLCASIEEGAFEDELKDIIFSHIPKYDRLGQNSLDELITLKTQVIRDQIEKIKGELSILNSKILILEEKQNPAYLSKLEENLRLKEDELSAHIQLKPAFQEPPTVDGEQFDDTNSSINTLRSELNANSIQLQNASSEIGRLNKEIELLSQRKQSLIALAISLSKEKEINKEVLEKFDIDVEEILVFKIDTNSLQNLIALKEENVSDLETTIGQESYLIKRQNQIQLELSELQNNLNKPARLYQEYLTNLEKWKIGESDIIGDSDNEGSIENIKFLISYVKNELNHDIRERVAERKKLIKDIFDKKIEILDIYKELYKSVTDFIGSHDTLMDSYKITFDTLFKESGLFSKFESIINFTSAGTFYGVSEGLSHLRDLFDECSFSSSEETYSFVFKILDSIKYDTRQGRRVHKEVRNQLKAGNTPIDLYNFICNLDYLIPAYDLKLSNKNVSTLSPGERGALLLIFYLILDNNHIPLIIDQPEENLDNQSVYKLLVPFIKMAKSNRQVIIVTHNPNLAVVCDADQIIYVRIDKENKNEVFVQSGGLENSEISAKIVEILEGTYPAFFTRKNTYNIASKVA
ncbi:hypothetical protein M0L20_07900 [Spirosoma sp. RP8]|uniref:AAA family ATPase n=1 Tax=Spirosoma liriopis TaxID=2937440 RepID=A0ABT0HHY3_9BACT|nr:hypothetical protein [Spirosoma liriopis]MCK8491772.1 hypothetical protein [Spirosoma liriopis]